MNNNFLDELEQVEAKAKRPSPDKKQITNPLSAISTAEVRRATSIQGHDPSMVGQQLRRSLLIPPEMDEEINRICQKYHIRKMEMLRFLLAKGLEDVHNGALENSLVQKVILELPTPQWKSVG